MPGWLVILIVILCVLVFMMLVNPTGPCHWCPYFCHNRRASNNADADAELQPVDVNPSNVKLENAQDMELENAQDLELENA